MKKWCWGAVLTAAALACTGCRLDPSAGTVTVVISIPQMAGMNAGSNAVDESGVNRAVSDWLVLDDTGTAMVVLHQGLCSVVFDAGTVLTVYCTVWVGPQEDNDVRFTATKRVTVSGDRIVVFTLPDNAP